ncbi:hypothetical protein [Amycolatopsis lurida]|uniref:Lipoprotein n=1 Tax=Amycolatopsis lurida NRRL 2430 TaxID=1460371 RepID=A0A2P2FFF6_AMYLU|nr:hypothetical protein [Amycolatopsis lurida]KFU75453.1 hypothetical protein BB31_41355 [Amycolatopsis lurida NRRL 2430]
MKKTLGRLAGAVLAGAVISLAVTPVAMAQTESTTTPPAPSSEAPSSAPSPSSPGGDVTSTPTESSAPASSSSHEPTPTSSGKPTSGKPSPTSTSEKPTTTTAPPEEPYVDNVGAGYIGENGIGALVIACESGEPTNVSAPDFDTVYGNQAEDDGRYWVYIVKVKKSFKGNSSTFTWTCDGKPGKADIEFEAPIGGGAATPGKPEKQVKYAPKGGIETGFGATAA